MDDIMDDAAYVLTDDRDFRAQVASLVGCSISLFLSLFICVASAWIYSIPSARHHLDRVSFRLLLWSMVVELLYNSVYLYIFSDPAARMSNATSCGATVYLLIAAMGTANWLCTFIGVNLMLAICFGINPVRARLERWYIIISFLMGFGLSIIPAGMGDFGIDNVYEACYFTETDETERIKDFILDLYLWQMLSCLLAAASVVAVLFTLLRQSRATGRALCRANGLNITSHDLREITSTVSASPLPTTPEAQKHTTWYRRILPPFLRRAEPPPRERRESGLNRLEDKFITIALKISLYPLALIVINGFITAEDLEYTINGGVDSPSDYVVYCIYYFFYGGRGMFFALLGIFVDPCLRRGLPAAYKATFQRTHSDMLPIVSERTNNAIDTLTMDDELQAESLTDFLSSPIALVDGKFILPLPIPDVTESQREEGRSRWWRVRWGRRRTSPLDVQDGTERSDSPAIDEKSFIIPRLDVDIIVPPLSTITLPASSKLPPPLPHPSTVDSIPPRIPSKPAAPHLSDNPFLQPGRPTQGRYGPHPPTPSDWVQPLASAILTPESPRAVPRSSSDPAIGDTFRRRRELRAAAEKMYAEVQAQL